MDVWTVQNSSAKQVALAALCGAAGLALVVAFRQAGASGGNAVAGFLLGLLLLLLGLGGVLVAGTQAVVIDPAARRITIRDTNRLGSTTRLISFDDVRDVQIGYLGKRSNFVTWYYLVLTLRDGEQYPLFAPGRCYEGGSDRATVESWRDRLHAYLGPRPTH